MADNSIEVYSEAAATRAFRATPRFGHSNDFVDLRRTDEESQDYLQGLVIVACVFAGIFVLCLLLLAIFKLMGRERVGFLSGAPFVKSEDRRSSRFCYRNRPLICRVLFLVCGVIFIVFAVLFVVLGLANFHTGADEMIDNAEQTRVLLVEASDIAQEVRNLSPVVEAASVRVLQSLRNYSMKVERDEGILGQALDSACGGFGFLGATCSVPEFLNSTKGDEEAVDDLRALLADVDEVLVDVQEAADEHASMIEEAEEQATSFTEVTKSTWLNWFIVVTYSLTPCLLMSGVVMAWLGIDHQRYRTFLSWVILPIFVLQIIAAVAISSAVVVGGVMNADGCSGGADSTPDGTLFELLEAEGIEEDSIEFEFANQYIGEKCGFSPRENPVSVVVNYQEELSLAVSAISASVDALEKSGSFVIRAIDMLEQARPAAFEGEDVDWLSTDFETLIQDIGNVTDSTEIIVDKLIYFLVQVECEDILPLYTDATYDGACTYSVTGLRWMFYGFTVVAIMGLIMIMVRSSWQLDEDDSKHASDGTVEYR